MGMGPTGTEMGSDLGHRGLGHTPVPLSVIGGSIPAFFWGVLSCVGAKLVGRLGITAVLPVLTSTIDLLQRLSPFLFFFKLHPVAPHSSIFICPDQRCGVASAGIRSAGTPAATEASPSKLPGCPARRSSREQTVSMPRHAALAEATPGCLHPLSPGTQRPACLGSRSSDGWSPTCTLVCISC